jgi:hypothetical protein
MNTVKPVDSVPALLCGLVAMLTEGWDANT